MASPTFKLIAKVTVGAGGQAAIDFNSIPSTFSNLVLKGSTRSARTNTVSEIFIKLNGSATGFTSRILYGTGVAAGSFTGTVTSGVSDGNSSTSNTFGSYELLIPNYTGSSNKSFSGDSTSENNATQSYSYLTAGLWSNSAAITSISLTDESGANFLQNSTVYLYGISNS